MKLTQLSNCHNAPVTIGGVGDFDDKDQVVTQYYICSKCNKPCDLKHTQNENDRELDKILVPLMMGVEVNEPLPKGMHITAPSLALVEAKQQINSLINKSNTELLEWVIDRLITNDVHFPHTQVEFEERIKQLERQE